MLAYKSWIKDRVLLLAGTTSDDFTDANSKYSPKYDKYDEVDKIIFRNAIDLDDRYISIFGLLYRCHSEEEVIDRLIAKDFKKRKRSTIRRYSSESRKRIVEIVAKNPEVIESLTKVVQKILKGRDG